MSDNGWIEALEIKVVVAHGEVARDIVTEVSWTWLVMRAGGKDMSFKALLSLSHPGELGQLEQIVSRLNDQLVASIGAKLDKNKNSSILHTPPKAVHSCESISSTGKFHQGVGGEN